MCKKAHLPAQADLEMPFGALPPKVHCPICGQLAVDMGVEMEHQPCEHLAFAYFMDYPSFLYRSEDFKQRFGEKFPTSLTEYEYALDIKTLPSDLTEIGYDQTFFVMTMTFGGMACGPVWYSYVLGFDFSA